MGAVIQHPTLLNARQQEAATRLHELANTVEDIVTALVDARCGDIPAEARDGITALVCLNVAARASGRASIAMNGDPLADWRSAQTLGGAVIAEALEQAAQR